LLLAGCAVGIALACAGGADAQAFQATPTTVAGSVSYTRSTPGTETIQVGSTTAVVNWTPTDNAGSGTIALLPQGNSVRFDSTAEIGDAYTILNRIVPADTGRAINLDGIVQAYQGGTSTHGGAVWFYSPGGIIVGADARFDVGRLLLTANDVVLDGSNDPYGAGGKIQLRAASGSTSGVTISGGAQINALEPGSYVALVAPRVTQGGTVQINGATAMIAAESVDMTFTAGLFDIKVLAGATGGATILTHSGTTTGPSSTGSSDPHRIYAVAVSKNSAITMLLGGTMGYAASGSASIENGEIVLAAGRDIAGGDPPAAPPAIGEAAALSMSGLAATAPIKGFASAGVTIANSALPIARLDSGGDITATGSTISGSGQISAPAGNNIALAGPDIAVGDLSALNVTISSTGNVATGAIASGRDTSITGAGSVRTGAITVGDDLDISGQSVDLQALVANTSGYDNEGNGRVISLTTTSGLLKLANANAATDINLTTTSDAGIQASALTTGRSITIRSNGNGPIAVDTLDAGTDISLAAGGAGAISGSDFQAGNAISVTGHSTLSFGNLSGLYVDLRTDGAIAAADIDAGRDLDVSSSAGPVTLARLVSGDDITISGDSVDLQSLEANTSGYDNEGNGRNITITTLSGLLKLTTATAATDIALTADSAAGIITQGLTAGRNIMLHSTANGDLSLTTLTAGSSITLQTDGSGAIGATTLQAGDTLYVRGQQGISLGDITSLYIDMASAGGPIVAHNLTAGRDIAVTSTDAVTLASIVSGDDIAISGRSVDLQSLEANTSGYDNEGNGRNITVTTTTGALDLTTATAATDITLTTNGAAPITAQGLNAGRSITVHSIGNGALSLTTLSATTGDINLLSDGSGTITATTLQAGNSAYVRGQTDVTLGDVTSLYVDFASAAGPFVAHDLTVGRDLNVTSGGDVTLAALLSGDDIAISGRRVDLQSIEANTSGYDNEGNGRNIAITATSGPLDLTTATASTDITLTANGAAPITAQGLIAGRTITVHSTGAGALALATLSAGTGDINLLADGAGTITATTLQAGNQVYVRGQAGVSLGDITALYADLANGAAPFVVQDVTIGRDVGIHSGGAITLAHLTSGDDIDISGASVDLTDLVADVSGYDNEGNGRNISVATTTGLLKLANATAANRIALTTASDAGIQAGGLNGVTGIAIHSTGAGPLALTTLTASNGDITLTGDSGGTITSTSVQAGGTVTLNAHAAASLGDVSALYATLNGTDTIAAHSMTIRRDLVIATSGAASVGSIAVGDDMAISAQSVDLPSLEANTSGYDNEGDGRNIAVTTTNGLLSIGQATASTGIRLLTASAGGITADALSAGGTIEAHSSNAGPIALRTADAGNAIILTGDSSGPISSTHLTAGNSVQLSANGPASLGIVEGLYIALTSASSIAADTMTAGRDIDITAGALTANGFTSGDDITIHADSVDAGAFHVLDTGYDNEGDGRNLRITTSGPLRVGHADAVTDIALLSTAGTVDVTDALPGRNLAVEGANVRVASSQDLTLSSAITTHGDLTLAAARNVTLPATVLPGALAVTAGGTINVTGNLSGASLSLFSGDIAITGGQLSASSIAIGSIGAASTVIGGSGTAPGYTLSQAEFARLHAPAVTVAAGSGTLTIDTLTATGSGAGTSGGVPNGTIAGPAGLLAFAGDTIEVVGPLQLTNALSTDRLLLAAVGRLSVTVPAGSIAVLDNAGSLAGTLGLRGDTIFVGTSKAASDVAVASDVVARTDRLGINDGTATNAGYVRANALELVGGQSIQIQNSGGGDTAQRAGFSAGTGGIRLLSAGGGEVEFIVNGRIGSTTGGDVGPAVLLTDGSAPTRYSPYSSVNGCVIATSGCQAPVLPPPPPPPPTPTPPPVPTPTPTPTPTPVPTPTPPPSPPSDIMDAVATALSQAQATIALIQPQDGSTAPTLSSGLLSALNYRGPGTQVITLGGGLISGTEAQKYEFVTGFGAENSGAGDTNLAARPDENPVEALVPAAADEADTGLSFSPRLTTPGADPRNDTAAPAPQSVIAGSPQGRTAPLIGAGTDQPSGDRHHAARGRLISKP